MADPRPNFDRIARPYRWLEYLSFGPYLERCRFHFLGELGDCRSALVLGDGDGRFAAGLLAQNCGVTVEAVDSSAAMLQLLTERARKLGPVAVARLHTAQSDALHFRPGRATEYDLVATHFFLDCLSESELSVILANITPHLALGAAWVVSEFAIPPRQPAALLSRLLIAALYRAFGVLTGLKVRRLPAYAPLLRHSGLSLRYQKLLLGGLLVSQFWRLDSSG